MDIHWSKLVDKMYNHQFYWWANESGKLAKTVWIWSTSETNQIENHVQHGWFFVSFGVLLLQLCVKYNKRAKTGEKKEPSILFRASHCCVCCSYMRYTDTEANHSEFVLKTASYRMKRANTLMPPPLPTHYHHHHHQHIWINKSFYDYQKTERKIHFLGTML